MPDFTTPQVAIGTLDTFYDTQVVQAADMPHTSPRSLLPGAWEWRYWTVTVSLDGGTEQTVICRLKVAHRAPGAPSDAIALAAGRYPTWVRVTSADETEIVPTTTRLEVG